MIKFHSEFTKCPSGPSHTNFTSLQPVTPSMELKIPNISEFRYLIIGIITLDRLSFGFSPRTRSFRFAIRIDSIHLANRFGSHVRFDCTGCWRLSGKPPIDGLPQLTRQSRYHTRARVIITHQCRHSSVTAQTRSGILTSLFNGRAYATVMRLSVVVCL